MGDGGDLELPVTMAANALEPLICLAEGDFGLACLPLFAVRRQLARGILVSVLEDQIRDFGAFHILWPSSRHPSPKLAAFVAFMAETLLSDPQPVLCRDAER
jgi:DNA-binding transcriptional LysR family regulator